MAENQEFLWFVCFLLLSPVNFLGGLSNRYTIAATFGATASKCATLFINIVIRNAHFDLGGPDWLKSKFLALRNVLVCLLLYTITTDVR